MMTYTGVVLATSSMPLWSNTLLLPALFVLSATCTGIGALIIMIRLLRGREAETTIAPLRRAFMALLIRRRGTVVGIIMHDDIWHRLQEEHQELAPWLAFGHDVAIAQAEAGADIMRSTLAVDDPARGERVEAGQLQLPAAELSIDADAFGALATAILGVIAAHCPDAIAPLAVPAASAPLWEALAREALQGASRAADLLADDALSLAVSLALEPLLRPLAGQILAHLDVTPWRRAYCPICGAVPEFALLSADNGTRHLVCGCCDTRWPIGRLGCPFCRTLEHDRIRYYPSEDGVYRLYTCDACGCYFKVVDERQACRQFSVALERILTLPMDLAAEQQGYRPPSLENLLTQNQETKIL